MATSMGRLYLFKTLSQHTPKTLLRRCTTCHAYPSGINQAIFRTLNMVGVNQPLGDPIPFPPCCGVMGTDSLGVWFHNWGDVRECKNITGINLHVTKSLVILAVMEWFAT